MLLKRNTWSVNIVGVVKMSTSLKVCFLEFVLPD